MLHNYIAATFSVVINQIKTLEPEIILKNLNQISATEETVACMFYDLKKKLKVW